MIEPGRPAVPDRARPVLWVVVGVLLAAAVAAAVAVGGREDAGQRVTAAAGTAEDAGTLRFAITTSSMTGGFSFSATTDGEVDGRTGRSHAVTTAGGRSIELVSAGDELFVRLPAAAREGAGGRTWGRLDLDAITKGLGGGATNASPLPAFAQLRDAGDAGDVEEVGREQVRGADTTHFRTVVDLRASVGRTLAAAAGPAADEVLDQLRAVPVDVWLDDEDRARRIRTPLELTFPAAMGGTRVAVVTTVESFDFGKPVAIEVPAPADVADAPVDPTALFGAAPVPTGA